jgi:hypothetical protein
MTHEITRNFEARIRRNLHAGIRVFLQGRAEPGRGLVASPDRPAMQAEHQASTLPVALSDPRLPFTRENEQAGYSWQHSAQQVGFSITMTLGAGRGRDLATV